jgi:hypothetical protein
MLLFIVSIFALNLVAANFIRLTGQVIDKPAEVVFHKGNIYLSVMNKKSKISKESMTAAVEKYSSYLPEKEALFAEAKKWYNMTRTLFEKR